MGDDMTGEIPNATGITRGESVGTILSDLIMYKGPSQVKWSGMYMAPYFLKITLRDFVIFLAGRKRIQYSNLNRQNNCEDNRNDFC